MKKLNFEYLPLDKIDISLSNVRKANANIEEGIGELASSIKEIGIQQPVVVFQKGDIHQRVIKCDFLNVWNLSVNNESSSFL